MSANDSWRSRGLHGKLVTIALRAWSRRRIIPGQGLEGGLRRPHRAAARRRLPRRGHAEPGAAPGGMRDRGTFDTSPWTDRPAGPAPVRRLTRGPRARPPGRRVRALPGALRAPPQEALARLRRRRGRGRPRRRRVGGRRGARARGGRSGGRPGGAGEGSRLGFLVRARRGRPVRRGRRRRRRRRGGGARRGRGLVPARVRPVVQRLRGRARPRCRPVDLGRLSPGRRRVARRAEPRCVHAEFGQAQAGRRQREADGDQHHTLAAPAVDGGLAVATARVRRGGRALRSPADRPGPAPGGVRPAPAARRSRLS